MRVCHTAHVLLVAVIWLAGPVVSPASILDSASVLVTITTPDGSLPPQTIVRLDLASQPLLTWERTTDTGSDVSFRSLPPGVYDVTIRARGFQTLSNRVTLRAGATTMMKAELRRDAGTPGGVVVLRVDVARNVVTFDTSQLAQLPSNHNAWSVLETADARVIVDRIDNMGAQSAEPARLSAGGSSWTMPTWQLGSADVTDPLLGGTPLVAPTASMTTMIVATGGLPADVAGAGPVIELLPETSEAGWHGVMSGEWMAFSSHADTGSSHVPPIVRIDAQSDVEGAIGHGSGRVAPFIAARYDESRRHERDDPASLRDALGLLFANVALTPAPANRVQIVAAVQSAVAPYAGRARFHDRSVTATATGWHLDATWHHWSTKGTTWSIGSGFSRSTLAPRLPGGQDPVANAGTVDRVRDGPVPSLFDAEPGHRQRWSARIDAQPVLAVLGPRHDVRLGVELSRNVATAHALTPPWVFETVNGLPARVWMYAPGGPETEWHSTDVEGYLADRIRLTNRLTLDAGLRLVSASGAAGSADNGITWFSAAPRIGARWQFDDAGRIAAFGSYGRYTHRLPLSYLAFGDPSALSASVFRWDDANRDGVFQPGELGPRIASVGPCCNGTMRNTIDPSLHAPHTDEFLLGVEQHIGKTVSWRLLATDRRIRELVESVNVGVGPADYAVRLVPDRAEDYDNPADDRPLLVYDRDPASFGRDRYVLTNPPGHSSLFQALDLTIVASVGSRCRTLFGAAAYRSEGLGANRGFRATEADQGIVGELFDVPNADTFARGRLFFDRAFVIKWSGSWLAPGGVTVAGAARYQDGQPFARLAIVPDLQQGPEVIQAYARGRTRFSYTLTLDTRVEKSVTVGPARLDIVLLVSNLLNTANEVEEDAVTGPTFRSPTAVQPPRSASIGLRVSF